MKKNILIVGSSGKLGATITQILLNSGQKCYLSHNKNAYFINSRHFNFFLNNIGDIFDLNKIGIVIFAAHVENSNQSNIKNAMKSFIKSCIDKRFIYISSDGIFNGNRGNYSEKDNPKPITLYGKNLLTCEELIKENFQDYCIVRPAYLFGYAKGRLDGRLYHASFTLQKGEECKKFSNMYKSPICFAQAAEIIAKISLSSYRGILHVSGERLNIFNFTKRAMTALGIDTKKLIKSDINKQSPKETLLKDTSLNNSLMKRLIGIMPLSIEEALK